MSWRPTEAQRVVLAKLADAGDAGLPTSTGTDGGCVSGMTAASLIRRELAGYTFPNGQTRVLLTEAGRQLARRLFEQNAKPLDIKR